MWHSLELRKTLNMQWALAGSCSLAVLAATAGSGARAQNSEAPEPSPTAGERSQDREQSEIVVIGNRVIVASLQGVPVEQSYEQDIIDSYDVSTIGDLLDEIRSENGDREPAILVNGQPVSDPDDIAGLPVEAVTRVEALPRGAAQRVGGVAGERAYNVVLKPRVRSAALTGGRQFATEGGWGNSKGDALLTYIKGQDRFNVTLRGADSGNLFEAERNFVSGTESYPYSAIGNVIPVSGSEVDPALSVLAQEPVSIMALPQGNANPTLAALVAGANRSNPGNQGSYRTLRGASRPYEVAAAGSKVLAPWLTISVNGRLGWSRSETFNGLPSALFLLPASSPHTPFSTSVYIAVSDPSRPLRSVSHGNTQSLSATFNSSFGKWRANVAGRWDEQERVYKSEFTGSLSGDSGTIGPSTNPFDGSLGSHIPVSSRESQYKGTTTQITTDADGPLFRLFAGPMLARVGFGASWVDYHATDTSGDRKFERREYSIKAGLTIPLTSRGDDRFLPLLGDSELAFDVARADLGRFGTLDRHSLAFNWQLSDWLRFVASTQRVENPVPAEFLSAPELITPNVPYFDPLTGGTVEVTTVFGGAGNLQGEDLRSKALSWTLTPLRKYRVQLHVDYLSDDLRDQIGSLPPPSDAVVAAFPDRFQRDASGTLVLVDNRFVNFARRRSEQLRLGGGFTLPLVEAVMVAADGRVDAATRRIPPLNLEVRGSYSVMLSDKIIIREGLPEIDMLGGGAIGVSGGRQRHAWDFDLALTKGKTGLRAAVRNHGVRYLAAGGPAAPDLITFHSITTVDLKVFTDLGRLFPSSGVVRDARVTVAVDNLLNDRQRVDDRAGGVPNAYQPARLDPVGRTVLVELRKVF